MSFIESLQKSLENHKLLQPQSAHEYSDFELKVMVAFLLAHAAYADQDISGAERKEMLGLLKTHLELGNEEADQILHTAEFFVDKRGKLESIGRVITENFDKDQRETLLAMYIRVLEADGVVHPEEIRDVDHMLRVLDLSPESIDRAKSLHQP